MLSRVLLSLFLIYILLPKIDLIPLGGSALRIGEFIVFFSMIIFLYSNRGNIYINRVAVSYLIFLSVQILSILINNQNINFSSLFFVARLVEYMIWFSIAFSLAKILDGAAITQSFLIVTLILSFWAILEFYGLVPKFGKFEVVSNRVTVNTSGPYEFAVVISFLLLIVSAWPAKVASFVSLLLTQSRITIFAVLVLLAVKNRRWTALLFALFLPLLISYGDSFVEFGSETRFSSVILSEATFDVVRQYFDAARPIQDSDDYFNMTYKGGGELQFLHLIDMSLEMRLMRWSFIITTIFDNLGNFLFGMGPGFWGVAVDGYYLRVLGETGFVGVMAFSYFVMTTLKTYKDDNLIRSYMFILLVTGVFIDIFVADKPMSLFWFGLGLASGSNQMYKQGSVS